MKKYVDCILIRGNRVVRLILCLQIVLLSVSFTFSLPSTQTENIIFSTQSEDVIFSLITEKNYYNDGETVFLKLSLENLSQNSIFINIEPQDEFWGFDLEIKNSEDKQILYRNNTPRIGSTTSVEISSGEKYQIELKLKNLPSDTYSIRAIKNYMFWSKNKKKKLNIKSNTHKISINPK